MSRKPEESEVAVFRSFVANLVSIHKQLEKKYQGDTFFLDKLLKEVEIPEIQACLNDYMPRKSQNAMHQNGNRLIVKAVTAG